MAASEAAPPRSPQPAGGTGSGPRQIDLDKCVHCGLCLNACPTYRELGLEMDSPRGRIYQMVQVAEGRATISDSYREHIDLCLACRGCESACPSGVQYGRLVEEARAAIATATRPPLMTRLLRRFVFGYFLESRMALRAAGLALYGYQKSGVQRVLRSSGVFKLMGRLGGAEAIAPQAELPDFFGYYGRTLKPASGARRYRVAMLGGCLANVFFARLNEATVRVLQQNGCEVVVPADQTCCGALQVHSGAKADAQRCARQNIDAMVDGGYDAIITDAAGCGSTLKEYHHLLADDPAYAERARRFVALVKDVTEFLASIDLNPRLAPLSCVVTYQDSCHLAHGQKIKVAPRVLLRQIPGITLIEMANADVCCGSAGIYNVVQNEMAMAILARKMDAVNASGAQVIATANPGCMLQLRAGVELHGRPGQRVMHVVELLDEAYRAYEG
jgi:glycolate oxidase iron-sulfur subunit